MPSGKAGNRLEALFALLAPRPEDGGDDDPKRLAQSLSVVAAQGEATELDDRVALLRRRRRLLRVERQNRIAQLQARKLALAQRLVEGVDNAKAKHVLNARLMHQQLETTSRRLQELLFECLGEYEKAYRRLVIRNAFQIQNVDNRLKEVRLQLAFTRFAERVCADFLGFVRYVDVDTGAPDFRKLSTLVAHRLVHSAAKKDLGGFAVQRILVFAPDYQGSAPPAPRSSRKGEATANMVTRVAATLSELSEVVAVAASVTSKPLRAHHKALGAAAHSAGGSGTGSLFQNNVHPVRLLRNNPKQNKSPLPAQLGAYLSNDGIKWLLLPAFEQDDDAAAAHSQSPPPKPLPPPPPPPPLRFDAVQPADARVYFCLEDLPPREGLDTIIDTCLGIYPACREALNNLRRQYHLSWALRRAHGIGAGANGEAMPRGRRARVTGRLGTHRRRREFADCQFAPDVLVAGDALLDDGTRGPRHFAAATVAHLILNEDVRAQISTVSASARQAAATLFPYVERLGFARLPLYVVVGPARLGRRPAPGDAAPAEYLRPLPQVCLAELSHLELFRGMEAWEDPLSGNSIGLGLGFGPAPSSLPSSLLLLPELLMPQAQTAVPGARTAAMEALVGGAATWEAATSAAPSAGLEADVNATVGTLRQRYVAVLNPQVPGLHGERPPEQPSRSAAAGRFGPDPEEPEPPFADEELCEMLRLGNCSFLVVLGPSGGEAASAPSQQQASLHEMAAAADAGAAMPPSPRKSKRHWDGNILGDVCRWRSCLCTKGNGGGGGKKSGGSQHLCDTHAALKAFLDSTSKAEASRFLPKKPPTNADRLSDARLIRYASSLLTEINNGKLYATIKTFCRRSVAEASAKARHSGRMHQQSSYAHSKATSLKYIPPAWVQWKDAAGLARAHNERDREEQILRAILEIERGLSGRLRRIERFPRAEIMALRREGAVGMGMYCPEQHAPDSADSDADDSDTDDRGGGTLLRELGWSRRKEALIEHVYLQATASPGSNAPSAHSLGVMSPSRFDLLAGVRSSG
eukprot:CAMPEP_0118857104 /NCGR_PEP_ID=MMETSP1163-20130328/4343_1 /TAXON_ID=124430 /ORGANISM="Phaeomonas parva, Strain CCMP2877" /LENGTH=1033 /DNA_ID=CAMNT_0006790357 /DNA_START=145 /DNA_END=3246 /DNA_ORIENTATION=+